MKVFLRRPGSAVAVIPTFKFHQECKVHNMCNTHIVFNTTLLNQEKVSIKDQIGSLSLSSLVLQLIFFFSSTYQTCRASIRKEGY